MGTECKDAASSTSTSIINTFDYVIVGSGPSAIGILYGLLEGISTTSKDFDSSEESFSIAIIERGSGPPHDGTTHYPHRWYEAATSTSSDNNNSSSKSSVKLYPSKIMGRVMDIPVGQGLGGTSNINACLTLPPLQKDLKTWPEPYRSSLCSNARYIKRIMENNHVIQEYTSAVENNSSSSQHYNNNPFSQKKQDTKKVEFYTKVPTLVARDETTGQLVRRNYYDGLLKPLLKKYPHLKKSKSDYEYRELHATRRTILCAGAIETPALLLVSKIGGEKEPLLCGGIGKHLRDQALLARVFLKSPSFQEKVGDQSSNGIVALGHLHNTNANSATSWGDSLDSTFQVAVTDSAADAYIIPSVVAMALRWKFQSNILMELVEIIYRCVKTVIHYAIIYTPVGWIIHHLTTTTMIFLMHPRSYGNVTISLKKYHIVPKGEPTRRRDVTIQADPKYLDDPRDVIALKSAWDVCHGLTSASSFEIFPHLLFSLLKPFGNKNFWFESYCRCFLLPYYHFSGTCAMKSRTHEGKNENPHWVVDPCLKLRGHNGLYICDASVFPGMISNPPALTCAALGLEFARMILDEHNIIE
ncbi:FAD/NAD(P)-binding domain-containing protein [Fragilariopsis cylindrus CCMP1102]|uniref:FAD/NAD(P)-binding domain-containing protein n=1 Tax=Fragilariopsis cylindrus CCMP1102 TaxID=635003 RepID=A0A1E7EUE8_9STRA|nr:FAD/NAD(P)-binding domain-containing protein [Fragilariopsis cylindrus CCMP1102]|eukprot:OEU09477.1 FAD/NAD(P)-binding domain-containing protein [Fragilariopsis cylindrus CCMP1102]